MNLANKHKIITPFQHGFMKNRSIETALCAKKEFILHNFQNKNLVLALFLNFRKAVDCINHKILLAKMNRYGVRGQALDLMQSYLFRRCQYVDINGSTSELLQLRCGSILGQFFFILYINDIINISSHAFFNIDADDTTICISGITETK